MASSYSFSIRFVLKSSEFRVAAFFRLGISYHIPRLLRSVIVICKFGGGPVWQHNTIVSTWAKCLDELNIPHQVEPRNRYTDSENRPDIQHMIPLDT